MMLTMSNIMRCPRLTKSPVRLLIIRHWHKEHIPVAWQRPKIGWIKLNFDGSCKGKTGKSSIGGLFRNHKVKLLLGYAQSIGRTTSTIAELAALRRGLELVLENGWNDVWLEGDSMNLVQIIARKRVVKCEETKRNVRHINSMIPVLNNCVVTHVYREGNRGANKLAQMAHHLEEPQIWRESPPFEVLSILHDDATGKIVLRRK